MARQLRIQFEGAYYHILSRGNNQCDIFCTDDDRKEFLDILGEISARFDVEIYAYVLMSDHYHLLLRTLQPNLSKCMQWLGTRYTRRFNLRNCQSGHLFQGRFKSILVENDAYLLRLSYYIHRNPLRAGIVKHLAEYEHSSYRSYIYQHMGPAWLKTDLLLSQFDNVKDKKKAYRYKVQRYADEKKRIWDDVKFGFIYGSQAFSDRIRMLFQSHGLNYELPQLNKILKTEEPHVFINKVSKYMACDVEQFIESGRLLGDDRDKRDILLYLLWETGRYDNKTIGEALGLKYSSVSKRVYHVKAELKKGISGNIKKMYDQINTRINV